MRESVKEMRNVLSNLTIIGPETDLNEPTYGANAAVYKTRAESLRDHWELFIVAGPSFGYWRLSLSALCNYLTRKLWIVRDWQTKS